MTEFRAGQRFLDMNEAESREPRGGIWEFLGWRLADVAPGRATLEWETTTDHAFPAGDDWIVHGGMVTALLDTAMGQSTWTLLDHGEAFLTADLHTDFYRPARPGLLRAEGRVVHKTRRTAFAVADLYDASGKLLAAGRVTNLMLDAKKSS
jgi:uncharacterized protein (TIGR00369 family)